MGVQNLKDKVQNWHACSSNFKRFRSRVTRQFNFYIFISSLFVQAIAHLNYKGRMVFVCFDEAWYVKG